MKKLIIVNNNMRIGGVQKSLVNLLSEIKDQYDVTLLLFSKTGEYLENIPASVKVIFCTSWFRLLGVAQNECHGLSKWIRGCLALITKYFGRDTAMRLISLTQKKLQGSYDCAISFLHNPGKHSFYGGCNEFVLSKVNAKQKITFLHCDYRQCGANYPASNRLYSRFDKIAACSDGCKKAFLAVLPELKERTFTVANCHNFADVTGKSKAFDVTYAPGTTHVVTVARMTPEKGIDRALYAMAEVLKSGARVCYHVVGNGVNSDKLQALVKELQIKKAVIFHGFQANPYPYIKNAALLLIPSYHEAAPMVIDEARCLGVPVLSTETTSSTDMITDRECGWVCENSQEGITSKLLEVLNTPDALGRMKARIQTEKPSNQTAIEQFTTIIER